MEHTKSIAVTGVAVLMVFGTGAAALAAVPSSDGVINGCRSNWLSTIRIIDAEAGQRCNAHETALNWNQTGPQGPAGRDGTDGAAGPAGPAGAQGQKGDPGITDAYSTRALSVALPVNNNRNTDVLALNLPAGAYVIQATASIFHLGRGTGTCSFGDGVSFTGIGFSWSETSDDPVSVLSARTYDEPTTVTFRCGISGALGADDGSANQPVMVATRVGAVHQTY